MPCRVRSVKGGGVSGDEFTCCRLAGGGSCISHVQIVPETMAATCNWCVRHGIPVLRGPISGMRIDSPVRVGSRSDQSAADTWGAVDDGGCCVVGWRQPSERSRMIQVRPHGRRQAVQRGGCDRACLTSAGSVVVPAVFSDVLVTPLKATPKQMAAPASAMGVIARTAGGLPTTSSSTPTAAISPISPPSVTATANIVSAPFVGRDCARTASARGRQWLCGRRRRRASPLVAVPHR